MAGCAIPPAVLQVEAFTMALLQQRRMWNTAVLDQWQRSLRHRTRKLRFQKRLWYHLVHRTNLRSQPASARPLLSEYLQRDFRTGQ